MKEFKCPICGCMEHHSIKVLGEQKKVYKNENGYMREKVIVPNALLSVYFQIPDGSYKMDTNLSAYVCTDCGFVSLFKEKASKKK